MVSRTDLQFLLPFIMLKYGLLTLKLFLFFPHQFIATADDKYEDYRHNNGFATEYIFHGGCVPSLNHVISSMAAASRLRLHTVKYFNNPLHAVNICKKFLLGA